MSTDVQVYERQEVSIAQRDLDMYRKHFCPDAPDNEWQIFTEKCRLMGLNPMLNEVHLVGRNTKTKDKYGNEKWETKYATQVAITGLIALAERTGRYEGHTAPEYYDEDLHSYPVWPTSKGPHPYAIRIGAFKKGWREPSYIVTYFHERAQYYKDKQGNQNLMSQWEKQGIHMHLKCALAAVLRWAFQETCGGVYIHEEMGTANIVSVIPDVDITDAETNETLKEAVKTKAQAPTKPAMSQISTASSNVTNAPTASPNEQSDALKMLIAKAKARAKAAGKASNIDEWWAFVEECLGEDVRDLSLGQVAKINGCLTRIEHGTQASAA